MRFFRIARIAASLAIVVVVASVDCATPTALTVTVYSEVACSTGATVALVGGALSDLATKAPSSVSAGCTGAGAEALMGAVVLVPAGAKNESVAFAMMTRPDGQSPDRCLDPSQASACIVAKRELLFIPRTELEMRVDLRLSCLGVTCATNETCVKGACVSAGVVSSECLASCGEGSLGSADGGAPRDSGVDAPTTDSGRDAGVDAPCDACGHPVVLASGQSYPYSVAVDATSVYWTDHAAPGGTVAKVPIGGGAVTTLASGQNGPYAIAIDATSVYWTNTVGTINKVPIGGGPVKVLASGQGSPAGIAVDATSVYWTNVEVAGVVAKVPLGGGAVTTLASAQSGAAGIAVDGANVYWANSNDEPNGTVNKVPIGGGAVTTLAAGLGQPTSVAIDATSVYFTTNSSGLYKVPKSGGSLTLLTAQNVGPNGLAVDSTSVYWTAYIGDVNKLPIGGGNPTVLASAQVTPWGLAVDTTSVYWANDSSSTGTIAKVAK